MILLIYSLGTHHGTLKGRIELKSLLSFFFHSDEKSINSKKYNKNKSTRFKSVSCQTEGKIILYPPESRLVNSSFGSTRSLDAKTVPTMWGGDFSTDLTSMSSGDAAKSASYAHPVIPTNQKMKNYPKIRQNLNPLHGDDLQRSTQSANKLISVFGQGLTVPMKLPKLL